MKKLLIALVLCLLLPPLCLAEEEAPICNFDFDAYYMVDAMLQLTYADGSVVETGGWGISCEWTEGKTIGDVVAGYDVTGVEALYAEDTFEGWLAFDVTTTVDEDGWEEYVYTLATGELLTTEEVMALPLPESYTMYVAKWAGIPAEEYFPAEESGEEFVVYMPSATLLANRGGILIDSEDEDYEIDMNVGTAEPGQTLGEVLELHRVLAVTKEGYTFAGWNVYEVVEVETLDAAPEEGATYFEPYDDWFLVFREYTLLGEKLSTEEVSAMTFGENDVYVVAMWE